MLKIFLHSSREICGAQRCFETRVGEQRVLSSEIANDNGNNSERREIVQHELRHVCGERGRGGLVQSIFS